MTKFSKEVVLVLGAAGAAALITATTLYRYNKRKNKIPDKWVEVGSVSDLWIYPLKSGGAMEVKEFQCTQTGPVFLEENKFPLKDRGFLIYNEKDGEQYTARQYPKLVLIRVTALSEDEIRLDAPDLDPLIIKTSIENPELAPCKLWYGESLQCIDCGSEAAEWISQYCFKNNTGLRIGLSCDWKRNVTTKPWSEITGVYENLTNEDMGIFSDLASYSVCNRASVEDLNKKLPDDIISGLNFRPNIVIDGPEAFAEDHWDWIKIGEDVIFRNTKPAIRCRMVNVDPKTGISIPEQAVLKKLREYRLTTDKKRREIDGNAPTMGIYLGIRNQGWIKLGDRVYVG